MAAPLAGVRVVEIAQNIAVPYCGRLLRGLGAEVVKIEPPGGDAMRVQIQLDAGADAPPEAAAFAVVNHGKRSVALDLGHPDAQGIVDSLVSWADVMLVALKPDDVDRYHLGYERLRAVNPKVIVLDHRPFGSAGPYGRSGGYDVLMQGLSGMAVSTGRAVPSGAYPLTVRPAFNDFGTGMLSALAVVAALRARDQDDNPSGAGQRVSSSLLATALNFMAPIVSRFDSLDDDLADDWAAAEAAFDAGASFETVREAYEDSKIHNGIFGLYFRHYRTADGFVSIGALSPALQIRFHRATGVTNPRDIGAKPGTEAWHGLIDAAEQALAANTTAEWIGIMTAAGVPASRFNLPHDALTDEQVVANEFRSELDHPNFGHYITPSMPIGFSSTPVVADTPSPVLDADTDSVLESIGYGADEITALRANRVIGWPGR